VSRACSFQAQTPSRRESGTKHLAKAETVLNRIQSVSGKSSFQIRGVRGEEGGVVVSGGGGAVEVRTFGGGSLVWTTRTRTAENSIVKEALAQWVLSHQTGGD